MPVDPNAEVEISAFEWVPDFAQGKVRDLRVRWALEEAGVPYRTRLLSQGDQEKPEYRALQPFGQVPTFKHHGLVLFESGAIGSTSAGSPKRSCPATRALAPARPSGWSRRSTPSSPS